MFEGSLGAVLIDNIVAGRVDASHVVPPFVSSVLIFFLSLKSVPQTLLSEVFVNDFVSGNLVV